MVVSGERASCYFYMFVTCLTLLAVIQQTISCKTNYHDRDSILRSQANISCLYSEFKTITCAWSLEECYKIVGKKPLNIEENVHIYYSFNVKSTQYCYRDRQVYLRCVCLQSGKTECSWSHKSIQASESLSLLVTVSDSSSSKLLSSCSQQFELSLLDIVQPPPVNNLAAENITNDGCLLVTWNHFWSYTDYICELTTFSHQGKMTWNFYYLQEAPTHVFRTPICHLHPSKYTLLKVRCGVMAMQTARGFWSSFSKLFIEFGNTVPDSFPYSVISVLLIVDFAMLTSLVVVVAVTICLRLRAVTKKIRIPETASMSCENLTTIIRVEKMLDKNILPENEDIQTINKLCGRQSENMKTLCGRICRVINRKMYKDAATDIWPAWDPAIDKVVFVVELTKITKSRSSSLHSDLEIIEYTRNCSAFEKESHMVMVKEKEWLTNQSNVYPFHLQSFQKQISTYSKELMDKHKNITAIFPSTIKSVGYLKSGKHRFIETLCISIRVEKKVSGLIPLEEERISTYFGQFPTDIIAGDFYLLGEGPNDFHENVKNGSAIHAGLVTDKGDILGGTMGCFVKHKIFGLCGMTSAHTILSQAEIQEVLKDGYREYDRNSLKPVYQPISKRLSQFGQVVAAACNEGQSDTPGVEVALIQIVCRKPISGSFPITDANKEHTFTFNSGNVVDAKLLKPLTEVFKFGIETGQTFGLLGIPGVSVRYRGGLRLQNQVIIMPKKDAPFAEKGDSGSSAFIGVSCPGTEAAIGLVTGGFDSGQVLVTPIHAALAAVQCPPYLHRFEDVGGDSGLNDDNAEGCERMECN